MMYEIVYGQTNRKVYKQGKEKMKMYGKLVTGKKKVRERWNEYALCFFQK